MTESKIIGDIKKDLRALSIKVDRLTHMVTEIWKALGLDPSLPTVHGIVTPTPPARPRGPTPPPPSIRKPPVLTQ